VPAPNAKLEALAASIFRMSPPDQLRVAAGLLENRQAKLAYTVANRVTTELGAALALRDLKKADGERKAGP
jgi:hypothetical protein